MGHTSAVGVVDARVALERLQEITASADPYQPAPLRWIEELHEALNAVGLQRHVQRHRSDGLHGINMAYLHLRVGMVLAEFEGLVADRPRLRPTDHR